MKAKKKEQKQIVRRPDTTDIGKTVIVLKCEMHRISKGSLGTIEGLVEDGYAVRVKECVVFVEPQNLEFQNHEKEI